MMINNNKTNKESKVKHFKNNTWVWSKKTGKGGTVEDFDGVDRFFVVFHDNTSSWVKNTNLKDKF